MFAIIPVVPGEKRAVFVGGQGSEPSGGFNGGGTGAIEPSCCEGYGGGGGGYYGGGGGGGGSGYGGGPGGGGGGGSSYIWSRRLQLAVKQSRYRTKPARFGPLGA